MLRTFLLSQSISLARVMCKSRNCGFISELTSSSSRAWPMDRSNSSGSPPPGLMTLLTSISWRKGEIGHVEVMLTCRREINRQATVNAEVLQRGKYVKWVDEGVEYPLDWIGMELQRGITFKERRPRGHCSRIFSPRLLGEHK